MIVDYAHTPAGPGRWRWPRPATWPARVGVICLFGCGGDRDQGKRSGDGGGGHTPCRRHRAHIRQPRSEDPDGHHRGHPPRHRRRSPPVVVEPDRARAIGRAVGVAEPGDVVLLAGKGHETTQRSRGGSWPFDDRVEARRAPGRPVRGGIGVISLMTSGGRGPVGGRAVHPDADPVAHQAQHRPTDHGRTVPRSTSPRPGPPPWGASASWPRWSSATSPPTPSPASRSPGRAR